MKRARIVKSVLKEKNKIEGWDACQQISRIILKL